VRSKALQRGERKKEAHRRESEIGPGNEPEKLIGPSSSMSSFWYLEPASYRFG